MTLLAVDAQAFLWFLEDNPKLSSIAAEALADPKAQLRLSVIALAEVLLVIAKGKSSPKRAAVLDALRVDWRISVMGVTRSDVMTGADLAGLASLHDRFIVATALRLQKQDGFRGLVTSDREIASANLIPVMW